MHPPRWKVTLILLVTLAGLVFSLPSLFSRETVEAWPSWLPKQQINLGLDLQGGSHLLLEVDSAAVVADRLEELVGDVRVALRGADIGYRGLEREGDAVVFTLTDPSRSAAAQAALAELNRPIGAGAGLSMFGPGALGSNELDIRDEGGGRISVRLSDAGRSDHIRSAVRQSLEVVRRRIDELGTRETTIQQQGEDRVLVQVPGERNPENIKRLLGQTARLTFHMVDMQASIEDALAGRVPPGSMLLPGSEARADGRPDYYVIKRRVELSGESLVDAQPTFERNQPVVSFRFDTAGGRKFGQITQEHTGELFAIVLDGKVISAPRINEPILGGSGIISGNFTVESATELAVLLRAGALPAPLTVVEERSVGPDLGADSIRAGAIASVVSLALVIGFMLVYYGIFGLFAILALVVNLILVLAIMALLGATLTLPGIAGVVLTIGQAVDSNVLIYERIREEFRNGKTPFKAIDSGFAEATRTIIDANLTTLIAAAALFQFGSGPVKGFAVTLGIGIITTMFTAVTFTRVVVAWWAATTRPKTITL